METSRSRAPSAISKFAARYLPFQATTVEHRCADAYNGVQSPASDALIESWEYLSRALPALARSGAVLERAASLLVSTLSNGGMVLVAGNGGSAAESQHFAAELVGRFRCERRGLRVVSLTADSAVLTAVGNDFGYEDVFARQVEALAVAGDVLVLFSTSGRSGNLLRAILRAREVGAKVVAIVGSASSPAGRAADLCISTLEGEPCRTQEAHIVVIHVLCELVEAAVTRATPELVMAVESQS